ncbi:TRAP transporter substrate-binding protein [Salinicola avicenniae]|uniref:TRAP transporter substrate-binding protein n=1 Tax=Salinicola avicenniae TaxID=2916836 RepID=UPI0020735C8F|nr:MULTISPECIES: TRAP transporter substrate-binding protein [unclassified Salinicola]
MKPTLSRLAVLGTATLLGTSAISAQAATQLMIVTPWPEGNFQAQTLKQFSAAVEEATDGEVILDVHSGGELGLKGPELLSAVRDGIVQGADMLLTQQVGEAPLLGIESVPYLTRDEDDAALLRETAWPYYEDVAARFNQKFLYTVPWPGQGVFTQQPVETVDDLAGVKLRTVDKNGTEFFDALGASPVQMPWGEVVPALASGAIDGVTTSTPSGVDGNFWEFTDYFNKLDWQLAPDVVSINLDAWNSLTDEQQQTIESLAREMEPQFQQVSKDEDARNAQILADNGIQLSSPDAAMSEALTEAAQPQWQQFREAAGAEADELMTRYLEARDAD